MSDAKPPLATPIRLRRFTRLLVLCWTVAIGAVLAWEIQDERDQAIDVALSEARGAWGKEAAVRRWDAANGGVYVPVTDTTRPDPFLSHLPEELTGKTWAELAPPENRPAAEADFQQMLKGTRGHDLRERFLCKSGKTLEASLSTQVLRKEDGMVDCVLVLVHER